MGVLNKWILYEATWSFEGFRICSSHLNVYISLPWTEERRPACVGIGWAVADVPFPSRPRSRPAGSLCSKPERSGGRGGLTSRLKDKQGVKTHPNQLKYVSLYVDVSPSVCLMMLSSSRGYLVSLCISDTSRSLSCSLRQWGLASHSWWRYDDWNSVNTNQRVRH